VVIGATNYLERLLSAILSRFGKQIEVKLPSPSERKTIFKHEIAKLPNLRSVLEEKDFDLLAEDTTETYQELL
jgi:AAA+ superfamily predicted ATPase